MDKMNSFKYIVLRLLGLRARRYYPTDRMKELYLRHHKQLPWDNEVLCLTESQSLDYMMYSSTLWSDAKERTEMSDELMKVIHIYDEDFKTRKKLKE